VEGSPLVLPDVQGDQLPTTFAVMLFKTISSDPEDAWMAEALQDSFNSVLSQISGVKVYSKEFLDFQIKKRSFTEMEAVSHLGIDKMLSGSLIVDGDVLRLDLYVIDVDTGTLDASYPSVGAANDFLDFRSRIVVEMLDRLELPMSDRERAELARLETGDVEPLRRLLEIESGSGTEPGPEPEKKPSAPAEPHSWIRWLEPDVAWAADDTMDGPSSDAAEISELLVRYGEAMERESVDELAAMYTSYSDEQRRAQEQFFDAVADLRVEITQIEIDVVGDEAIVSYTRSDRFIDVPTGQPMHLSVRPTKVLARQDGVWRLVAGSE
jgi:TolB-like protein